MDTTTAQDTATPYAVTFAKSDADFGHRYNVELDGEKVGWVTKTRAGRWGFHATVRS